MERLIDQWGQLKAGVRPRRFVKMLAKLTLFEMMVLPLVACDPFNTGFDEVENAHYYVAKSITPAPAPKEHIVVLNWNVKFGGARIDFWFDCHGDRVLMSKDEVIENLDGLAKKIRQVNPDILLVQEIDVDAKRAAFVDQMQWLLDHTELNYGAYASQWKADYIPSDGIGRMNSGSGIFSRWKIVDGTRFALPQMDQQDALTRYFYLKRNILQAVVDVPEFGPLYVLNIHTDAYSQDGTKKKQLDIFEKMLDDLNTQGKLFVAGGDLNTVPPGTVKMHGFEDSVCEDDDFLAGDYRGEVGWIDGLYEKYKSAIPLEDYQADNTPYLTHSVSKDVFWNQKLDYLFTNGSFVDGSGLTHQDKRSGGVDTMPLSDHAPLSVQLKLERP